MNLEDMTIPELKKVAAGIRINVNYLRNLRKADIIEVIEHVTALDAVATNIVEPFSREWHEANVDRVASQLRHVVAQWFECDRDDADVIYRLQGQMQLLSRSMSSELAGIAWINNREYNRRIS